MNANTLDRAFGRLDTNLQRKKTLVVRTNEVFECLDALVEERVTLLAVVFESVERLDLGIERESTLGFAQDFFLFRHCFILSWKRMESRRHFEQ